MPQSCVYGLVVNSNVSIPGGFTCGPTIRCDLEVHLGSMPKWLDNALEGADERYRSPYCDEYGEPSLMIWKLSGGGYFRLRYADGTEFLVDNHGNKLWATWPDDLTVDDTATYLLGPVMGFVLLLRGTHSLHASAVAVDGKAVVLVGAPGAGKSTTAAAFAQRGYSILAEDIVAISDETDRFVIMPGYPRIRLWPESVSALYGAPDALPPLTPTWNKRYLDLRIDGHSFQQEPLPLAAVYVLQDRRADSCALCVEQLTANAGLMALVANTYASLLMDKAMRAREFNLLTRITAGVQIRRVTPHVSASFLSELCDLILNDYHSISEAESVSVGIPQLHAQR